MLTRAAAARNFEVQAANSRDLIGKSLDGIALLLPLALDIRCGGLQRLGTGNVTLADLACKLLDVCSKALRQYLLVGAHDKPQWHDECRYVMMRHIAPGRLAKQSSSGSTPRLPTKPFRPSKRQ